MQVIKRAERVNEGTEQYPIYHAILKCNRCKTTEMHRLAWTDDKGRMISEYECKQQRMACGHFAFAQFVYGKFSIEHICNGKCINATGPDCECTCGGKNHGTGHQLGRKVA